MKKLKLALTRFIPALILVIVFQASANAQDSKVATPSALSSVEVIGFVALLIALVVAPAFKRRKLTTK